MDCPYSLLYMVTGGNWQGMTFGERVRALRKLRNLSQDQLAKLADISQPSLSSIERGETQLGDIKDGTMTGLLRALAVNRPFLTRGNGSLDDQSDDLEQIELPPSMMEGIPVVGSVRGGPDGYYAELEHATGQGEGFIRYPTRDPNTYALRVKGDSMRPRIRPGEFIVVSPNSAPIVGDEAVIKTRDGRVMVKLYQAPRNGQIELHSINHDHKPITIETREIEYIHHVLIIAKADTYYPSMGL